MNHPAAEETVCSFVSFLVSPQVDHGALPLRAQRLRLFPPAVLSCYFTQKKLSVSCQTTNNAVLLYVLTNNGNVQQTNLITEIWFWNLICFLQIIISRWFYIKVSEDVKNTETLNECRDTNTFSYFFFLQISQEIKNNFPRRSAETFLCLPLFFCSCKTGRRSVVLLLEDDKILQHL